MNTGENYLQIKNEMISILKECGRNEEDCKLIAVSKKYNDMETVRKMKQIVPEYKSNNSVYEELDLPVKTVASKHVAEMS